MYNEAPEAAVCGSPCVGHDLQDPNGINLHLPPPPPPQPPPAPHMATLSGRHPQAPHHSQQLNPPSSPPAQPADNQPPIHKWRTPPPSKGAQVCTPGSTSRHTPTPPPPPPRSGEKTPMFRRNVPASRFFSKRGSRCPGSQSQGANTPSFWLFGSWSNVETQSIPQFAKKNFPLSVCIWFYYYYSGTQYYSGQVRSGIASHHRPSARYSASHGKTSGRNTRTPRPREGTSG